MDRTEETSIPLRYVYAMAMVADRENWLIDFYHSPACFWAVEDGLFRTDMNDPTATFVFPKLHELRDSRKN